MGSSSGGESGFVVAWSCLYWHLLIQLAPRPPHTAAAIKKSKHSSLGNTRGSESCQDLPRVTERMSRKAEVGTPGTGFGKSQEGPCPREAWREPEDLPQSRLHSGLHSLEVSPNSALRRPAQAGSPGQPGGRPVSARSQPLPTLLG